jgi:glycosyltransferase involved in cell wall biosynthesis
MQDPLVSVNMITYNHEPYIRKAIDCILAQKTNFPFELVIGEDCSTDGTREIVFDYAGRYPDIIRVITSVRNVGMMKNVYRTGQACRGKYVAFCEGDDYWQRDDKLQMQADYLERHLECSLICSDYDTLYENSGKLISQCNRRQGLSPGAINDIKYIIRGTSGIQTCTVMARRDLTVRAIENNAEIFKSDKPQPCGDLPLWTALARLGTINYLDDSLATYRRLEVSAVHNLSKSWVLVTSIAMKEMILCLLDKYQMDEGEKYLHRQDLWKRKLMLAYYDKNPVMAMQAKGQLKNISLTEWMQYFGAIFPMLHVMVKPLIRLFCRSIPTVPKV